MTNKVLGLLIKFIIIFGICSLVPSEIFGMEGYVLTIIFLIASALTIGYFFKNILSEVTTKTKWSEMMILAFLSIVGHALTIFIIKSYAVQPNWFFGSRGTSFLLLNDYFLWAKPLDVFVQQLLIVLLVLKLRTVGVSLRAITTLVIFGFGVMHIFHGYRTDILISFGYTIMAIIFSIIFPYMILKVRNGYIYNFMIHLATYDIAALVAWFVL
jgi:hypothetical protein